VTAIVPLVVALAVAAQSPAPEWVPTHTVPPSWGTTFQGKIHSVNLDADRMVDLFLPASFDKTTRKFPIIFLTDGEYYFERAVTAVRQLSGSGHIPECVVAAVETPERRQDLTPPGMSKIHSDGPDQRGERFMRFLVDELGPALEKRARASAPVVLMGHSHGGILCHYAAAKWRKDVPVIVALDAPMHLDDGWLARGLIGSIPEKGSLRLVSLEVKFGWRDVDWANLLSLAPKTWKLTRIRLEGEDHETMVFDGFYRGLKEIFADYSAVGVKALGGPEAFAHYLALETPYGAPVIPPEFVLERAVRDLAAKGQGELARKALAMWEDGYGPRKDHAELTTQIAEAQRAMMGQESVEQLLAASPPTPDKMAPYLGVWKGTSWVSVDPGRKSAVTITFSIEDGHGVAKAVNHDAPEEFKHETFKFLRVTDDAIEFGNMNGMFPPGIVARVGRIQDGKLQGESVFKGIFLNELNEPDHPKHFFSLAREP
jgi:pimeloyl-ACP methyl ester carboxylesterase